MEQLQLSFGMVDTEVPPAALQGTVVPEKAVDSRATPKSAMVRSGASKSVKVRNAAAKTAAHQDSAPGRTAEPSSEFDLGGDSPTKPTQEPKILSVSDVNRAVKGFLESEFRTLWIKGEISNFKPHSSGHFYFALKDSKASISAVMFRGFNQGLKFRPQDGLEVIVRGKITVYEPRGSYQIFCEMMEPVGAGALQLAFEQLKRKLELEGLFAPHRKRPLPALPRHVAIVTSPTGAAVRDILNVLGRRFKGLRVTIVSAVVQGESAPASILDAIEKVQRLADVDVMIIGRGGGSIEDLWGFNHEMVARALANSRIPTISAVGHEIDFTIVDFVADLRAPTPSAAAELVCQNASEMQERLVLQHRRLIRAYTHRHQLHRQHLNNLTKRLIDPKRRLQDLALRCDELSQRLENAINRNFVSAHQRVRLALTRIPSPQKLIRARGQDVRLLRTQLETRLNRSFDRRRALFVRLAALLDAVSPLKVVERGYSISRKHGVVIKNSAQLAPGDSIDITFARGGVTARVEATRNEN